MHLNSNLGQNWTFLFPIIWAQLLDVETALGSIAALQVFKLSRHYVDFSFLYCTHGFNTYLMAGEAAGDLSTMAALIQSFSKSA
jgi:hypothetical protein